MKLYVTNDGICYVENMLSPGLCQEIVSLYQQDDFKQPGHVLRGRGEKEVETSVKVSTDLIIRDEGCWQAAFEAVDRAVNEALRQIVEQIPALQLWPLWRTGYKIQHYRQNEGHFKWHFDAIGPGSWDRQLAMVIYLNTVADGGETSFQRQNLQLKPLMGDGVFFPPFWTHAHCGEVPRSEDKYIISSFVAFSIPAEATGKP